MRIHRFPLILALVALLAIPLLRPLVIAEAQCPTGSSNIDVTQDCAGDVSGLPNTTNTIVNHANVNGTISGGDATTDNTVNNITNLSGATIDAPSSSHSEIYGGSNTSASASLTVNILNAGTIINTHDRDADIVLDGNNNTNGTGDNINTITNTGTISSFGTHASYIEIAGNASNTGNQTNTILNTGTITNGGTGYATIFGANSYSNGYTNNFLINTGKITSGGTALIEAYDNNSTSGSMLTDITNTGVISGGDNGQAVIIGSYNYTSSGSVTNNIVQNGLLSGGINTDVKVYGGDNQSSGGVTNNIFIGGTIQSVGPSQYTPVYGGDNSGSGVEITNIYVSGQILTADAHGVSIYGGTNTGTGTETNTTHLIGWSPTVAGTIKGDTIAAGNALDRLFFEMQTTNEGLYDQWKAEIAAFGGTIPSSGSIMWGDKVYTWQDIQELQDLVTFLLNVTWFDPGDGRLNGQPGDRLTVYCHADKNTVGVLLVNGDSQGNVGSSFDIKKLEALGKGGTSVNFGVNGVLSIMMDAQGSGWAAWNGGVDGANGQGVFAKLFSCPLR